MDKSWVDIGHNRNFTYIKKNTWDINELEVPSLHKKYLTGLLKYILRSSIKPGGQRGVFNNYHIGMGLLYFWLQIGNIYKL